MSHYFFTVRTHNVWYCGIGYKRLAEAKLHHEDRVKEYMADITDSNVELYERDKRYVRSK